MTITIHITNVVEDISVNIPPPEVTTVVIQDGGKSAYQVALENGYVGTVTQWLASLVGANGLNANMTRTSTTSLAIGTGTKTATYTSSSNLGWLVGTRLRFTYDVSNYMEGIVTAVSATSVTITSDNTLGSGTYAAWYISIIGDKGATGTTGNNGLNADMTRTSTTSNTIGSGSKTFAYATSNNLGWLVGTRLRFTYDVSNYMEGIVTAVSATSVTITSDNTLGSGTYASWNIAIAGDKGATGATGGTGSNGTNGVNADMMRTSITSLLIGSGTKTATYTSSSNLGWLVGTRLRFAYNASNYMEGAVTAVSATSVTITSDNILGSGTYTAWNIGIAGDKGATGATGADGNSYLTCLYKSTTLIQTTSKTAETSVLSITLPTMVSGSFRIFISYDVSTYVSGNSWISVRQGIIASPSDAQIVNQNRLAIGLSSTSVSASALSRGAMPLAAGASGTIRSIATIINTDTAGGNATQTTSIDTTVQNYLYITVWNTVATTVSNIRSIHIEYINS